MSSWPFLGPKPKPETFIDRVKHVQSGLDYAEIDIDYKEATALLNEAKRIYWNREDLKAIGERMLKIIEEFKSQCPNKSKSN